MFRLSKFIGDFNRPNLPVKSSLRLILNGLSVLFALLIGVGNVCAQEVVIPNYWNFESKSADYKPDIGETLVLGIDPRFPPFGYIDAEGLLRGFNVDLARNICLEVEVSCSIRVDTQENLSTLLEEGAVQVLITGLQPTGQLRKSFLFTNPYLKFPGRFITMTDQPHINIKPSAMKTKRIGFIKYSSHGRFLKRFFTSHQLKSYPDRESAWGALKRAEIDYIFDDGIASVFWLLSAKSENCCEFRGGAFVDSNFFGEGMALAVRRDNYNLHRVLNNALYRIFQRGVFSELYLLHFPISFY